MELCSRKNVKGNILEVLDEDRSTVLRAGLRKCSVKVFSDLIRFIRGLREGLL
jgi:hypothetical protein